MKTRTFDNPYVLMVILLILWGSLAAVSKLVLQKLDSFQVQFYIFGIAVLIMTPLLFINGKVREFKSITGKEYVKLFLFAVPSFLYFFLYTMSLKRIPAVEASMINYLFPIMIVLFSIPINNEKFDRFKLLSLVLGFVGMVIIVTGGHVGNIRISDITGDLLALGAAISWGIFSNLGKRNKSDAQVSNYIYTVVTFLLSALSVLLFSRFTVPTTASFAGLLTLALSNVVLAYYIWFRVLKSAPTLLAANLSFFAPFVTLLFIVLLLGERITLVQVLGLLAILAGSVCGGAASGRKQSNNVLFKISHKGKEGQF